MRSHRGPGWLPQSAVVTDERVAALCRFIFNFRMIVLLLTMLSLPLSDDDLAPLVVAILVATIASFVPLRYWSTFGPTLVRHPAFLAVDLLLTMMILTVTGPENPFFYFTLGTALLSGLLYGWIGAAVFSVLLVVCYWFGYSVRASIGVSTDLTYQIAVGFPALYPICAAAGAGVRRMLDRQSLMEAELASAARSSAIERERTRIAREMHDSLAKSIHGIGLQAAALTRWIGKDPPRAIADARSISQAAEVAAQQARELIRDLRADSLDLPLSGAVRALVEQWSEERGIDVGLELADVECACPEKRWELMSIVKEALHNVDRHARANHVRVALREAGGYLMLEVADDGAGFAGADRPEELVKGGHFGLMGMSERAQRVGGRLKVTSVPGDGTSVTAVMPLIGDEEKEGVPA
jgi:signal transduction histidine kinase